MKREKIYCENNNKMINSIAASSAEPKMYSATYVENYLDSVENLPNDVQRYLTRIREIDLQYRGKYCCYWCS